MRAADAGLDAQPLSTRAWRGGLIAILLLASALRLIALDKPLYIDEIVTIVVAMQPLDRMADVMRQIDASPALFPLLLHGWMAVSTADAWVRLLPAIFGILAVWVCGLTTARAFGPRAGLAAAAVLAIAPAHIHYAQYVRSYSLFTLLGMLHVWLFMQWMDAVAPPRRRLAVALTLATAALLYTHYLSLLLFGAEGLYAIYRWRAQRSRALGWGLTLAAGLLLFAPGVPLLLHNAAHDRVRNAERPEPRGIARVAPDLVAELNVGQRILGFDDPRVRRATLVGALVLFPVLAIAGARAAARTRAHMVVLMALVTLAPLAVYIGSGRRLIAVRFFLPFMLGALALTGAALASMRRGPRLVAAGALLLLAAIPLEHYYRDFQWSYDHRRVARAIAERAQPGDGLLVVHPYEAFFYRWYLRERMPITGLVFTALEDQDGYVIKPPPVRFEPARARALQAAARHERLWLVGQSPRSFASDPAEEARIVNWMDAEFTRVADLDYLTGGDPAIRLYRMRKETR
jgi:hypothetical protein